MHNDQELSTSLYSAGVDALHFTMQSKTVDAEWIRELTRRFIEDDREHGNDWKTTKRTVYEGIMTKHVFMGVYGDSNFIEIKGNYADEAAREIARSGATIKPTRCDLQVTYKGTQEATSYYKRLRSKFEKEAARLYGSAPAQGNSYSNPNGAWSVYLYTGDKNCLSRSYNKALESPGLVPDDARRHELQLRHRRAINAWAMVKVASSTQWLSRSMLLAHFMRYNLNEEWMSDTLPCALPSGYERSDNERRLAWFHNTACRVAERLLAAGYSSDEVFKPLIQQGVCALKLSNKSALKGSRYKAGLSQEDIDTWLKHGSLSSATP
jgi:hypothetical protein